MTQSVSEELFREYYEQYKDLIYKILNKRFLGRMTTEEINTIGMEVLHKCIMKFDDSRGFKFSTYLVTSLMNKSRSITEKQQNYEKFKKTYSIPQVCKESNIDDLLDLETILGKLKNKNKEFYSVLNDYFFNHMTHGEIGKKNGYTREMARIKVKQALEMCRLMVYN